MTERPGLQPQQREQRLLEKMDRLLDSGDRATALYVAEQLARFYEQALHSMALGDPRRMQLLVRLAQVQARAGHRDEPRTTLVPVFRHPIPVPAQAQAHLVLADIEHDQGRTRQQRLHLEAALTLAQECDEPELEAQVRCRLSDLAIVAGELATVEAELSAVRELLAAVPGQAALERVWLELNDARLSTERGRFEEGLTHLAAAEAAGKGASSSAVRTLLVRVESVRGDTLLRLGRPTEAMPLLEQGLRAARRTRNHLRIGWAHANLMEAALRLGDPMTGRTHLESAREALLHEGTPFVGRVLTVLEGMVLLVEGDHVRGSAMLTQARRALEEAQEQTYVGYCLAVWAELLVVVGKPKEAAERYDEAMAVYRAVGAEGMVDHLQRRKAAHC